MSEVKAKLHLESPKGTRAFVGDTVNIFTATKTYEHVVIAKISTSYSHYVVSFTNNSDTLMIDRIKDFTIVKRAKR